MKSKIYPFSALIGIEDVKKALILNLINPKIGGVLIAGEKGSGKTLIARSLANIADRKIIEVPANITEDHLVGSVDFKEAIKSGDKTFAPGILKRAHNNILFIDDINIMSEKILNTIIGVHSVKKNIVEREGISLSHASDFIMLATMNPEEGYLRSKILDRFGIFVYVEKVGKEEKFEIIKNHLSFHNKKKSFCEQYATRDQGLRRDIEDAKRRLKDVAYNHDHLETIAKIVQLANCEGHRGEYCLFHTAMALAAYYDRSELDFELIKEASEFVLPHRIRENPEIEPEYANAPEDKSREQGLNLDDFKDLQDFDHKDEGTKDIDTEGKEDREDWQDIEDFEADIELDITSKLYDKNLGTGKRSKVRSDLKRGRYITYRLPGLQNGDLAFLPTIKVAAINQFNREKISGMALNIKEEDFREKIRESKTGAHILFLVDASGSMGARKRMGAVKGAVLSILTEAYQKRDSVAIMAFRNDDAKVILNTTNSALRAKKSLRDIRTGGRTPLAKGLLQALSFFHKESIKGGNKLFYLVIVSDGKGNVPLYTDDAMEDVYRVADKYAHEDIQAMVLDTEQGFMQFGFAKKLSERLNCRYLKLEHITQEEIKSGIKDLMKR